MGFDATDMSLYLNIAFFSVLGLGLLFGLIKGFKKSLYTFIVTLIFLGVFFLTVNIVVEWFYSAEISFLNNLYSQFLPINGQPNSVREVVHLLLEDNAKDFFNTNQVSEEVIVFIDSIGMFVIKIVYTIIYFTAFQLIYRFLFFIIGLFIFAKGRSKNKKGKRNRPLGAVFGTLTAALNLFVMIIVLSGIISIAESLSSLQALQPVEQTSFEMSYNPKITDLNSSTQKIGRLNVSEFSETTSDPQLEEALEMLNGIVTAFNSNIFIQLIDSYKVEDEFTGEEKNMAILLFDEVLSINYKDDRIGLREDLKTFVSLANIYLESDYYTSNNINDIKSDEVTDMFETLSKSKLLVSILPIGIELGLYYLQGEDYVLDESTHDLLYSDINWQSEIQQLGAVVATGVLLLENANPTGEEIDFTTVAFDADLSQSMFNELSDSRLAEFGSFMAFEYLIEANATVKDIFITVPADINWADEFKSFGMIANEILSTGLTVTDFNDKEGQELLMLFVDVDLTVLLNSKITTTALVNILSGKTSISLDIEFLHIPNISDADWLDILGQDGELLEAGELRRILTSLSIMIQYLGEIDFNDIQIQDLGQFTDDDIDAIFESLVLVASISETIKSLDTGDVSLIIPDSVLDAQGYITKDEVKNLFKSLTLIASEVGCDVNEEGCDDTGFDFTKAFALSEADIDKLFISEILFATASYMVVGFEELVVPSDVITQISVNQELLDIVVRDEVKAAFIAINALGIEDPQNTEFDASILNNLSTDPDAGSTTLDRNKTDKLFASKILHATISKFLIDQATETETLKVPYYATENYPLKDINDPDETPTNVVRFIAGNATYISSYEMIEVLEAILLLEIDDFNNMSSIEVDQLIAHSNAILDSAILHATITDQLLNSEGMESLEVPSKDVDGVDVFVTTGTGDESFTYIKKSQLLSVFDALGLLNIVDFNDFDMESIDFNLVIDNADELLESAILHATISKQIQEQGNSDSLVIPSLDDQNNPIELNISGTYYISKAEIKNTLTALQVFEIDDFDDFNNIDFDTSLIKKLSVNADTNPSTLDEGKVSTILSSKIVHATLSKLILDAAEPDEISGETVLIVPYIASEDYNDETNEVRFVSDDDDIYIVEVELVELFRSVLALDIEDFNEVDTFLLSDILPHKEFIFDSAILHATISDKILVLTDDGSLTVPSLDLDNQEIIISRGNALLDQEVSFIIKLELQNMLVALDILGINDFNDVDVDTSIIQNLGKDSEPTELDETKSAQLLASKIVHATISKLILDAGEPDDVTGERDLIVPFIASENYSDDTDEVRFTSDDQDLYIVELELTELFRAVLALDIQDFSEVDTFLLSDILPHKDFIFDSAILHATISKTILDLTDDGSLTVPSLDLDNQEIIISRGNALLDQDVTYVIKLELQNTLVALDILGINDFNDVEVDTSIIQNLGKDSEPTELDETKSAQLLASKIVHATISKLIFDAGEPDEITGESDLIVPFIASENYSDDSDEVRFTSDDQDLYIVELELTELFRAVLALDIQDFSEVDTFLLSDILPHKDFIFDSAILHATISKTILDLTDDGSLTVPSLDLDNKEVIVTKGEILLNQDVTYVIKLELQNTLVALDILGINDFNDVDVDTSIIKQLADDENPTQLDEGKTADVLASKIVHATISKLILDAGEPDDITGERDLIVPFIASENYSDDTDEVRFTSDDQDLYIVELELTELFRAVIALDIDDFNQVDAILLSDILPHKDFIFDSAILHATISDTVIQLGLDGDLTVPSLDLSNGEVLTVKGEVLLNQDVTYVIKLELQNTLVALDILGINDFNNVDVDTSIIKQLADDENPTQLDEGKTADVLASKIVHATISKLILDAGEPDDITGERDLIVPFIASENYSDDTDEVRFTSDDQDLYIVELELTELFRAVIALDIDDFNQVDALLLSDILPHKDFIFDSAILHATISDTVIQLGLDGDLTVPSLDLLNGEVLTVKGDDLINQDVTYVVKLELQNTLVALDILGINDFNNVDVDTSIIKQLADDENPTQLDEGKTADVLASKIVHATISKLIFDAGEPDEITGERDLIVPFIASENYSDLTDEVRFVSNDLDKYIVELELTELFRAVIALDIDDFNQVDTLLLSDILPHKDFIFDSAILHATISDTIIQLGLDGDLTVPSLDLGNISITLTKGDALLNENVDYIIKLELQNTLVALDILGINDFNNVDVDTSIIKQLADEENPTQLDEGKTADVLASKIVHATISKLIFDAGEPDEITGERDLIVPFIASENYSDLTDEVRFVSNDLDKYIVELELTEVFRAVIALDIDDFNQIDALLITDILPHKDYIFDSAILHATISDTIIQLGLDGDLTVPSLDLGNISITLTKGDALLNENVDYIIKLELQNTLIALDILGINDFNNVDVDTSIIKQLADDQNPSQLDETKSAKVLDSKIIHATISKLIFDAGEPDEITGERDLIVPFIASENYSDLTDEVRFVSNDLDRYVVELELTEVFRAVIALDIDDFNQIDALLVTDILPHKDYIFDSAILHATISDTIIQLGLDGDLTVPSLDLSNLPITLTKGDASLNENVDYIIKLELQNTLIALDILGINDFNNVVIDASILQNLAVDPVNDPTTLSTQKKDDVLASKIIHASLSNMIIDAGTPDEITGDRELVVPHIASEAYIDLTNEVRFVTSDLDRYIVEVELTEFFEAILILDIDDFNNIETLELSNLILHQQEMLDSAILHATISKQVFDLEANNSNILVPVVNDLGQSIVFEDDTDALDVVTYLVKLELGYFFDAIDLLGNINTINDFQGNIELNLFFKSQYPATYEDNQDTLLKSSIMQVTISNKIDGLNTTGEMVVPMEDIDSVNISVTYAADYFIYKSEIQALIDVMDIAGLSTIESFDGQFRLSSFSSVDNQNTLLKSVIMHRTLSDQLLNNNSIIVPQVSLEDDLSQEAVRVTTVNFAENYISADEIKSLINVMNIISDPNSNIDQVSSDIDFSKFDENLYPGNQNILLSSAIMHASLSDELLALNDDVLFVPTYNQNSETLVDQVRFDNISGTDYIIKAEVKAIINSFLGLGYNDLDSLNATIEPGEFFNNIDLYLSSVSFHATISKKILEANNPSLIIPNRDIDDLYDVQIVQTDLTYIEHDEVKYLIEALSILGINDFSTQISGDSVTSLNEQELNDILRSGSMHLTIEGMIQDNNNITVPDLALDDLFALTNIITKAEVVNFILATSTVAGTNADITDVSFDLNAILALTPAERLIVLESMIVRNVITPQIETIASNPFDPYSLANEDYMNNDPATFLTKAAILAFIDDYES